MILIPILEYFITMHVGGRTMPTSMEWYVATRKKKKN